MIYVGAGTSGRLGVLDAAEMPPTFGTDPEMVQGIIAGGREALVRSQEGAEDRPEDGAAEIDRLGVGSDDFVMGIATSGTTPFVHGALARARECGARTGFLLCTQPGPELLETHDVVIAPLVGAEVVTGSTRMKAGTAKTNAGRSEGTRRLGNLSTPKRVQKLQKALHAKAKAEPSYRFYALYDKLYREDILHAAYAQCRSNRGAPGVDGQEFADIEAYGVQRWLGELAQALREERYRPDPIRRVFIPKANGQLRPLGISTLRDRVCPSRVRC